MKNNYKLFTLIGALLLMTGSANAAGIYDNNISALNINTLTDVFMSYTNYGAKMSALFRHRSMYGTMKRLDEYGDDGSTIRSETKPKQSSIFKDIWVNANHVNESMHYGQDISENGKFNLATIGTKIKAIKLKSGSISLGGFASYINAKMPDMHSNGDTVGVFARYRLHKFAATGLLNIGSLNNDANGTKFNNSWANIALGISNNFKIDETFYVRPDVYAAYTFVSSSDLYINGDKVSSNDYNFFNVAPGLTFIKEISPDWYGSLSAKYVAHFDGKNDINVNNVASEGLYIKNHTDVGIDVEHNFRQFVFGAKVHKQIGGIDGWSTNINVKYVF